MLWISWQARTQSPQRTHLFWSRTSSWSNFLTGDPWNSKWRWGISRVMINHGAWLDHESLPAYFKLTAWIAANVYAYVHGHTRTRGLIHVLCEISSKTLSTSSLTINAPLIVKDEVDQRFSKLSFSQQNKKSYVGLRLIVIWDPPVPGPLKGQDRRVHDYYSNRIVII